MAFQIRRAHRFFSPPQDQIALRTSDHASRGKSPGTFPAFRVYLRVGFAVTGIFVGISVIGTAIADPIDNSNRTGSPRSGLVQQLWKLTFQDTIKSEVIQATLATQDNNPVVLATTAKGVFRIGDNHDSRLTNTVSLIALGENDSRGDSVIIPSPGIATHVLASLVGILAHNDHQIARLTFMTVGDLAKPNVHGTKKSAFDLVDSRHIHYHISPDGLSIVGIDTLGRHVGLTSKDIIYRFFDGAGHAVSEIKTRPVSWDSSSFSPDGKAYLINVKDQGLSAYEPGSSKSLWTVPGSIKYFSCSNQASRRALVVKWDNNRIAHLYEDGKLSWSIDFLKSRIDEAIRNLAISPSGEYAAVSSSNSLLIFRADSSVPVGHITLEKELTINSVSVSNTGLVAIGAQQARLRGTEPAFGRVLLLNADGVIRFQEGTRHEQSNAWIPIVELDQQGRFLTIRTREFLSLYFIA